MPRADFDVNAYAQEILKGQSPEVVNQFLGVFGSEDAKNRLADSVLRHADYSRQTQQLAEERKSVAAKELEMERWYEQQLQVTKANQEEYERMQNELLQLRNGQAPKVVDQQNPQANADWISRRDYESNMSRIQQEGIQLMAQMSALQGRHIAEFGEALDTVTLTERAVRERVPLAVAYENSVAEQRAQRAEHMLAEKLNEAREQGRRDALSAMKLPVVPVNAEVHPLEARETIGAKIDIPAYRRGVAEFYDGTLQQESK